MPTTTIYALRYPATGVVNNVPVDMQHLAEDTEAALELKFAKAGGALTGDLTFSGASRRIKGDFSNATIASRTAWQTSTSNSGTTLTVLPAGTGVGSWSEYYAASDPANSSFLAVGHASGVGFVAAGKTGTGVYTALQLQAGGASRLSIGTNGTVGIAAPDSGNALIVAGLGGAYASQTVGANSTGGSYGAQVVAGTNASDYALMVTSRDGTRNMLTVRGDNLVSVLGGLNVGGALAVTGAITQGGVGVSLTTHNHTSTYVAKAGDTMTGDLSVTRGNSTGYLFLGNTGSRYIGFDGTNYVMPTSSLLVQGKLIRGHEELYTWWTSDGVYPLTEADIIVINVNSYTYLPSLVAGGYGRRVTVKNMSGSPQVVYAQDGNGIYDTAWRQPYTLQHGEALTVHGNSGYSGWLLV